MGTCFPTESKGEIQEVFLEEGPSETTLGSIDRFSLPMMRKGGTFQKGGARLEGEIGAAQGPQQDPPWKTLRTCWPHPHPAVPVLPQAPTLETLEDEWAPANGGLQEAEGCECGLRGLRTACRSPWMWLLPSMHWAVPKFPCDLQRHCPALGLGFPSVHQGVARKPSASPHPHPHPQWQACPPSPLPGLAVSGHAGPDTGLASADPARSRGPGGGRQAARRGARRPPRAQPSGCLFS